MDEILERSVAELEASVELARLVENGKAERPAIAKLTEWKELREWVVHATCAGASRGHIYIRRDAPAKLIKRLQKVHVDCANPECPIRFPAIRKHLNGEQWSIHVTGPKQGNAHRHCSHRKEANIQTEWLYFVTKQAGQSPRMKKAREDSRQGLMKIDENNDLIPL